MHATVLSLLFAVGLVAAQENAVTITVESATGCPTKPYVNRTISVLNDASQPYYNTNGNLDRVAALYETEGVSLCIPQNADGSNTVPDNEQYYLYDNTPMHISPRGVKIDHIVCGLEPHTLLPPRRIAMRPDHQSTPDDALESKVRRRLYRLMSSHNWAASWAKTPSQWQQYAGPPVPPSDSQFVENRIPEQHNSTIRNIPIRFPYSSEFVVAGDALPPLQSLTQQPDRPLSQSALLSTPKSRSTSDLTTSSYYHPSQVLNRLRRLDELDDIYPYKLIRKLDQIADEPSPLNQEKLVYVVTHVHDSAYEEDLTVEHLGTYTSAKAANSRVLDVWDRKYGAKMFTDVPRRDEHCNTTYVKINWAQDPESDSSRAPLGKKPDDASASSSSSSSSGGVEANNSRWAIADRCLTLSHKSCEEESKVYAVVSKLRG
ncbi:hypothetical protein F5Y14DRAFT_452036 [Nemania sp. NC0429]|nr:hypothetical protein F5Y14DRAFT_452036 [Nemania sp. NC0429]